MTRPFIGSLLLMAALQSAAAGGQAADPELQCRVVEGDGAGDGAGLSLNKLPGKELVIRRRADVCEAGVVFVPEAGQPLRGLLLLAPKELGLRARNQVLRASFDEMSWQPLGELPVSAERIAAQTYQDLVQEGGSLFLQRYVIGAEAITPAPDSLELVFDGELCLDKPAAVFVRGIGNGVCRQRQKVSVAKPVCVSHRDGAASVVGLKSCEALVQRLGK